jgi:hypothetical protein
MSCRYHFAGDHVLVCVFAGEYTLAETLATFQAGLDDPRAAGGVVVLIDVTASRSVKNPAEFQQVVQFLKSHGHFRGRIAVVSAADDPLRFGLSRQFAALTTMDGVPMKVHTSISDALAWLRRPEAEAEA